MNIKQLVSLLAALALAAASFTVQAQCRDNVVLVHGNTGSPADFAATRSELLARGWIAEQIFTPSWGSRICAACNDHSGSEEVPVASAIIDAIATSCSGRIDVIGHSMGVTLAAREIDQLGARNHVDSFVAVAGAFRGLRSCGVYPFNVWTSTCGAWGLSLGSPLVTSLRGGTFADRSWSIKSWYDEINCLGGVCTVGGVHTSTLPGEAGSLTLPLGHWGLLWYTAADQVDRIE